MGHAFGTMLLLSVDLCTWREDLDCRRQLDVVTTGAEVCIERIWYVLGAADIRFCICVLDLCVGEAGPENRDEWMSSSVSREIGG